MNNFLFKKIAVAFVGIAMAIGVGVGVSQTSGVKAAKATNYSQTYGYSDLKDMLSGNKTDASSYWKVPGTAGNTATIAIPITDQPTSDITLTFNIATFGSGTSPSKTNTTITAVGTETGSNWSGSGVSAYPSSSTYVDGVMTLTKPNDPTTLSGLTVTMGVNTGVKIFRLKSITVAYTYQANSFTVTYDANGATSGSAPTDSNSPYSGGANVTVLAKPNDLAKDYCTFGGWNTKADGSGTTYAAGSGTITNINDNVTLYAKWTFNKVHAGTLNDPYIVNEAKAAFDAGTSEEKTNVYVKGVVVAVPYTYTLKDGVTYDISDDGLTTSVIRAYKGVGSESYTVDSDDDVLVKDKVIVYGTLSKYGDSHQLSQGNQLISLTRPTYVTTGLSISGSFNGTYNTNTVSFDNSGFTVTRTKVNSEDNTDVINETVTEGVTFHWEYSNGGSVYLPFEAGEQSVKVWAEVDGETLTTKDNTTVASRYVASTITVQSAPAQIDITESEVADFAGAYAEYSWSAGGIGGIVYAYKSSGIQFGKVTNETYTGYMYNTIAVPGNITSIVFTITSGNKALDGYFDSNSEITAKPSETSPIAGSISGNTVTWTFQESDGIHYFYFVNESTSNAVKATNIQINFKRVSLVDPTSVTLNKSLLSLDTYGSETLSATVGPFNANNKNVTWSSSNAAVATVDTNTGFIKAKTVGNTTITATTSNGLTADCSLTVSQALYKKGTYEITSASTVEAKDDYLSTGSATISTTGSYVAAKHWIQLQGGQNLTLTISNYTNQKFIGFDIMMASNGATGAGTLSVTANGSSVHSISSATNFNDPAWNGAYSAFTTNVYKELETPAVIESGKTIQFVISCTTNSFYVASIAIRYLDYSLEQWCENFLSQITCTDVTQEHPDGAIISDANWGTLGTAFSGLSKDLRDIAAAASANKDSDSVIERAMARYDLILRKYGIGTGAGQHTDFIGRFGVGKINGPLTSRTLINGLESSSTPIIIVVISMASITAFGAFLFLRKRKEQ